MMTWDVLLLFEYALAHGKLPVSSLRSLHTQLEKLLSTHVYLDLVNHQGSGYTDDMYDRLVQDVYIRLYHKLFDNATEMFLLISLLSLRERGHDDRNLYSFLEWAYIIRVVASGIYMNHGSVYDLTNDTTHVWEYFKGIADSIEGYKVPVSRWNMIANRALVKFCFVVMEQLYNRNKRDMNKFKQQGHANEKGRNGETNPETKQVHRS